MTWRKHKVPKIQKILPYEMKCLVPNYSCLQNPWLGGYRPQIPVLSVLCPQLNLLNPHPNKIPGYATAICYVSPMWPLAEVVMWHGGQYTCQELTHAVNVQYTKNDWSTAPLRIQVSWDVMKCPVGDGLPMFQIIVGPLYLMLKRTTTIHQNEGNHWPKETALHRSRAVPSATTLRETLAT
jgi:hypothetical protein